MVSGYCVTAAALKPWILMNKFLIAARVRARYLRHFRHDFRVNLLSYDQHLHALDSSFSKVSLAVFLPDTAYKIKNVFLLSSYCGIQQMRPIHSPFPYTL